MPAERSPSPVSSYPALQAALDRLDTLTALCDQVLTAYALDQMDGHEFSPRLLEAFLALATHLNTPSNQFQPPQENA